MLDRAAFFTFSLVLLPKISNASSGRHNSFTIFIYLSLSNISARNELARFLDNIAVSRILNLSPLSVALGWGVVSFTRYRSVFSVVLSCLATFNLTPLFLSLANSSKILEDVR